MRTAPAGVKAAAVASGSRQYPAMVAAERRHTSPTSPGATGAASGSPAVTTVSSTPAWGRPTVSSASSGGSSKAVPRPTPASVHE